jgi:pyrimidine 5'-nucleotidase
MHDLIDKYMQFHLSLSPADAAHLHASYSKDYGLAIKGLVQHHKIDPLDFNRQVDDALPLDELILPSPSLRKLLLDIDRTKVKLFLFTNAHVTHGMRVVKLLGIDDLFEGITYCDYGAQELLCKPDVRAYEKAEREAGVKGVENVYFVGEFPVMFVDRMSLMSLRMITTLTAFMHKLVVGRRYIWWIRPMNGHMINQRRNIRLVVWTSYEMSFLSCSCQGRKGIETGQQRNEEKYRQEILRSFI